MTVLVIIVLILNAVVLVCHVLLQMTTLFSRKKKPEAVSLADNSMVSIHVPTHNESPDLVIKTLKSLLQLDYSNYEVIILDNNTDDEGLYLPVQNFCEDHDKLRFFHMDNVQGFKAGALNIASRLANKDSEYFLVIDADYCVEPEIIRKGLSKFTADNLGLVQFPQAYRNEKSSNCSLMMDYSYYFDLVLNQANGWNCPLPTGTLTFIKRAMLTSLGGWTTNTITEDAELGINIYNNKYKALYVPDIVGKGLAPYNYKALRKQRKRWIFGNIQILLSYLRKPSEVRLSFNVGIFLQLTAWMNFAGIPLLILIASVAIQIIAPFEQFHTIQLLSLGSIIFHLAGKLLLYLGYSLRSDIYTLKSAFNAWLIHVMLMYDGAFCWWKLFLGKNMPFETTPKVFGNYRGAFSYHVLVIPVLLSVYLLCQNVIAGFEFFTVLPILGIYILAPIQFLNNIQKR